MTISHTRSRGNSAVVERPGESYSASSLRCTSSIFDEVDPSVFMLGMPKSRPKFLAWGTIAILFGLAVAFLMIALSFS
jgi:hypothetical protein